MTLFAPTVLLPVCGTYHNQNNSFLFSTLGMVSRWAWKTSSILE